MNEQWFHPVFVGSCLPSPHPTGALEELQSELDMAIVQPILDPQLFESIGLSVPAGVLLFGPPGCGKTLVAKAVANQSGASFVSIKGALVGVRRVGCLLCSGAWGMRAKELNFMVARAVPPHRSRTPQPIRGRVRARRAHGI